MLLYTTFLSFFLISQENPANINLKDSPPSAVPNDTPKTKRPPKFVPPLKFSKDWKRNDRVLNQVVEVNTSMERRTAALPTPTPKRTKPVNIQQTKALNPFTYYPLPPSLLDCSIKGKKDALSAISRAKTPECKGLIKNLTCLQQANKLYDTDIKNQCPVGKNPGKAFERIPYVLGQGPLARVVFLLSVHGRAYRQVKRLFKAIYHTDHYYYIHVDSVR